MKRKLTPKGNWSQKFEQARRPSRIAAIIKAMSRHAIREVEQDLLAELRKLEKERASNV